MFDVLRKLPWLVLLAIAVAVMALIWAIVRLVTADNQIAKAVCWAVVVFLASAFVESAITIWMFRKYGGCPMIPEAKKVSTS